MSSVKIGVFREAVGAKFLGLRALDI